MNDSSSGVLAPKGASGWVDAVLLAAILATMLWGLDGYGLYEPHEAHFAGVGREMVLHHDWITPHLNGDPYLNKPPLFYWLIAASCKLFGINEFSARLPLALVGWGGVVLAWYWARQLWGLWAGRYAAAAFAVACGWQIFCHQLLIDALLAVLNLAWTFLLWRAVQKPASLGRWAAFYVAVAAGILAKGLIGLAFPVGLLFFFALIRRERGIIKSCWPLLGLALITALILPWVLPLEMRNPGTLYYMLVNEHLKRVLDVRWPPDYSVVKVSVLDYLGAALVWVAPWCLCLPQICAFVKRNFRRGEGQAADAGADAVLLLALSAALPVAAFLPMPSRLVYYTLPALPPLMVLAAGWWAEPESARKRPWRLLAAASFLVAGGVLLAVAFHPALKKFSYFNSTPEMPAFVARQMQFFGVALVGGGLMLALRQQVLSMLVVFLGLSLFGLSMCKGLALFDKVYSAKHLVTNLRPLAEDNVRWISEGSQEIGGSAGLSFYLRTDVEGRARTVLIMNDDKRRLPPEFPVPSKNLISHEQLDKLWAERSPALFVTDFQRDWDKAADAYIHAFVALELQNGWSKDLDFPWLPSGEKHLLPVEDGGNRRVFANAAAWAIFKKSHVN
jgi:4-amino-4-deoxy-L-arabinose transferase-like glycosyltransferase